jgi:hypothetical protein
VIEATTDEILGYLADVIERAERFGATVLPPNDAETVAWERDGDDLFMDLAVHPPVGRRARLVEIVLRERWRAVGSDRWELAEYGYELRHHELAYRRALHRHDVDYFVRTYGVATHEHCEATMGNPVCGHYLANPPCRGALDGFDRLYGVWLTGTKTDCSQLRCLG